MQVPIFFNSFFRQFKLLKRLLLLIIFLSGNTLSKGQQFIGINYGTHSGIQQMIFNPAWVNNAANGTEVQLASVSLLVGTNAYRFTKDWLTNGFSGAVEGEDYLKDSRQGKKHAWGNIDAIGPAISFRLKEGQHLGIYTRTREIFRAGNLSTEAFRLIGDMNMAQFPTSLTIENAGFTTHTFGEVGLCFGKILANDYYRVFKAGLTIKYVFGFAAGTIYTESTQVVKHTEDSLNTIKGTVTALFTENISPFSDNDFSNDIPSWFNRNGKGGLGLDIGIQYEFHPEGDPNRETPYTFSFAASLTDLGSINYVADTGSGVYDFRLKNKSMWQFNKDPYESNLTYFYRMQKDSIIKRTKQAGTFRVGLPTALRLNMDWDVLSDFWLQANVVLNLRGSGGDIYTSGYVNYFNLTPRYEKNWFSLGVPFSYIGAQTMAVGIALRAGPVYLGSASILSTLLNKQLRNLDGYASIVYKIKRRKE